VGFSFTEQIILLIKLKHHVMSTIEKKIVRSGKYVSADHLDSLISNYKKERWIQSSERMDQEDTFGGWYSVDELEEFIQTARKHGADGINIYFGVYGGKAQRPELEGKQTIALVATRTEQENGDTLVRRNPAVKNIGNLPNDDDFLIYNWSSPLGNPSKPGGLKTSGGSLGLTIVTDKDNNMSVI
jgi:hypothetical protein